MDEKEKQKIDGIEIYAKEIKNNGVISTDTYAKIVTDKYEGKGSVVKNENIKKKSLSDPTIIIGIIALIITLLAWLFPIGDSGHSLTMKDSPGSFQAQINAPVYGDVSINKLNEPKILSTSQLGSSTPENEMYKTKFYVVIADLPKESDYKINIHANREIGFSSSSTKIDSNESGNSMAVTSEGNTANGTHLVIYLYTRLPVQKDDFTFSLITPIRNNK